MKILSYLGIGTTGIEQKEHVYHETLANVMLVIAMGVLATFSVIHVLYEQYVMSIVQCVLCIVYAVAYFDPFKNVTKRFKENAVVIGTVLLFWFLIADGGIAKTGIYWVPFFPFMLFAVAGIRRGTLWAAFFGLGVLLLVVMDVNGIIDIPYSSTEMFFFSFAFFFYVIVGLIFEALRTRQQYELELQNDDLVDMREKLKVTLDTLEQEIEKRTFELKESNNKLLQEIEEHKKTNLELKDTEQKFYQAQKMEALGTLVGGIAHDFNSLLSGVNANLFLIQRHIKDIPQVQAPIDDIDKMIFHAANMTQQLLTYARKDDVHKAYYNLSLFMKEGIKLLHAILPSRIKLEKRVTRTALPVFGNTTQLQQVLINLVSNARDALSHQESPCVCVTVASLKEAYVQRKQHPVQGEDWVYIAVSDNGEGIKQENLEHIFDPFFTTKETGEGTGLGLAMVYGAVQSHGGTIEAESKKGQGSTFHIYLPMAKEEKNSDIQENIDQALQGRGENILLADDDEVLCQAQKSALENLGYDVKLASNGFEAIKCYAESDIDLVVMDIMMPEMGGIKAAQHIFTMNDQAKVIFASGYDKDSSTERFLSSDFEQVDRVRRLSKPFSIQQLCKMIRQELD